VFAVLNHLFNDLGYFPGGGQHGYLWWLAWGAHNGRTLFSVQDANGDFRPLFLQASCATYAQLANNISGAEAVLNVTSLLTSKTLCPQQAAADARAFAQWKRSPHARAAQARITPRSLLDGSALKNLFYPKLPTN